MNTRSGPSLIRRTDAAASGLTARDIDRLVRLGRWHRLLPLVYVTGALPPDPGALASLRIRAAVMWAEDCVIGGLAACWWNRWLRPVPATIELHIAHGRQLSAQPGFTIRRTALDPADVVEIRGVRTTAAARTALDLAARGNTDLLDLMLRDSWYDDEAIASALARGTGQRGWTRARQAVEGCHTRPFSGGERRLHRELIAAGVAGWRANVRLVISGRTVIPDVLFDKARLVVELDGHEHHSDRAVFESDRARQNLLVAAGYRVLRFTWRQLVDDPAGVVRRIVAELAKSAA